MSGLESFNLLCPLIPPSPLISLSCHTQFQGSEGSCSFPINGPFSVQCFHLHRLYMCMYTLKGEVPPDIQSKVTKVTKVTLGDYAFSCASPWNNLPVPLHIMPHQYPVEIEYFVLHEFTLLYYVHVVKDIFQTFQKPSRNLIFFTNLKTYIVWN